MRDFLNIMESHHYYQDKRWNRSDSTYTFETGSKIEFFSADQPGKVRGPRRDILFINEANNVPFETFDQLRVRTRKVIWLDWNPTHEFWFYTDVAPFTEHDFVTLTYKDNEALDPAIVTDIESHKHMTQWWRVYGMGLLGEVEGRIYTGWETIKSLPEEARLDRRGLDFGYSIDPAAIIDVYNWNGAFVLHERLYDKNMSNKSLADYLLSLPETTVYADSSEPKSIDEIASYGVDIHPSFKGPGSVNAGIQYVQAQKIYVTEGSLNLIKEYRNYMWQQDKDGRWINKPQDINNHLMDALRYALESYYYGLGESGFYSPALPTPRFKESPYVGQPDGTIVGTPINVEKILNDSHTYQGRSWRDM